MAYKLGQLFSYNAKTIIVAKDNRLSSITLLKSFIQGLVNCGSQVIELEGVSTSPLLYFASNYLKADGAVMITGSHNSLEDNGLKFLLNQKPFYGENLKNIISNKIVYGKGSHHLINLDNEYIKALNINSYPRFKIIWECNNCANGRIISKTNLYKHLLNIETNGEFSNIPPDPCIEKNLLNIKNIIKQYNADIGFAFDGDGDRLVMIKSNGEMLTGDQLIYLLASSLKNSANKKILIDVKASQILINYLNKQGFEVILAASGHSLMKERIIKENAIFAGESSGHFIFNDGKFFPFDDALHAALRIVDYLQNNPFVELPLAKFKEEYKIAKNNNFPAQVFKPEGLRKSYNDGFWLIRASNTEDYILVKYESETKELAKTIKKEIFTLINFIF